MYSLSLVNTIVVSFCKYPAGCTYVVLVPINVVHLLVNKFFSPVDEVYSSFLV